MKQNQSAAVERRPEVVATVNTVAIPAPPECGIIIHSRSYQELYFGPEGVGTPLEIDLYRYRTPAHILKLIVKVQQEYPYLLVRFVARLDDIIKDTFRHSLSEICRSERGLRLVWETGLLEVI